VVWNRTVFLCECVVVYFPISLDMVPRSLASGTFSGTAQCWNASSIAIFGVGLVLLVFCRGWCTAVPSPYLLPLVACGGRGLSLFIIKPPLVCIIAFDVLYDKSWSWNKCFSSVICDIFNTV
jgi:hypothetical protein